MTRKLVLHIAEWTWRPEDPIEDETLAWLREFGVTEAAFDVQVEDGEIHFPIRFTVSVTQDLPSGATEDSLSQRLRDAWDVSSVISEQMARRRQLSVNHAAYELDASARVLTYNDDGLRSDIPSDLLRELKNPATLDPSDPAIWPEPNYSSHNAAYLTRLHEAPRGMYPWDQDVLWKHVVKPQRADHLIFECNDDGLMATEDPQLVCHVHGLDSMPPYPTQFSEAVGVDDLLLNIVFSAHRRLQTAASGLLLRDSFFSHYIDYAHDKLNPTWLPHAAIGSMTGWIVHPETSPPYVELFGTNNAAFGDAVEKFNSHFATIGSSRVEWAVAHDLLVTGRVEPDLRLELRMFLADLIIDLIVARAGYLSARPDAEWRENPADAIPEGQATLSARMIVSHLSLLRTRELVRDYCDEIPPLIYFAVHPDSGKGGRQKHRLIQVEVETLAGPDGDQVVQQLVNLLGVPASTTEGSYLTGWTKRAVQPERQCLPAAAKGPHDV